MVKKPSTNKLRICIDPNALNKAIKREHHQICTAEENFGCLSGARYFSTLDATSGFLQVALDRNSSFLTTIATPFGRFRYLRLPFGFCSAPEVYHRIIAESFSDIPGVYTYIDDILVTGSTSEEHDKRLRLVLARYVTIPSSLLTSALHSGDLNRRIASNLFIKLTQQMYAQIEKELLAVKFGLEKYHQYVYGQSVIVETDHNPLLGIVSKPLAEVSPRLQRMLLRCLRYQFKLIYKPGKDMTLADALSRAPTPALYAEHDELTEEQAAVVVHQTIPTPVGRERCRSAKAQDPTMQAIKNFIHIGWPQNRKAVPDPFKPFWNVRYDLTEKDGIIIKGSQAVLQYP